MFTINFNIRILISLCYKIRTPSSVNVGAIGF
nr:MAG TPA: hypothetical protein [Caudoviricetes sp.]